jgi:N-acetylglucosamine-6-phosphate deacetylase
MTGTAGVIHSTRLVASGGIVDDAWVRFADGVVAARGVGDGWREALDPATDVTDGRGHVLAPGFIDLHCHGGGGASIEDGEAAIATIQAAHAAHGTTRTVLSLVTAPIDDLVARLGMVARLTVSDPRVLGAHLEGPFLDHGYCGAHDPAQIITADPQLVDRLLAAAGGTLRQITIAPEHPGAMEAIRRFVDAGVAVAVGHTAADVDTARAAFEAGASLLTHAFNAMPGIRSREPGPVAAALRAEHVTLEVINDGVHVHPDAVRLLLAAAPGRVALVTDAMAAAGAGDGVYALGSRRVVVDGGVARLEGSDTLAGSTLTQDAAVRRAVLELGLPLGAAISAVTEVPAAAIGRGPDLGRLDPGYAADAVLLDDDLAVTAVWAAGQRLH